MRTTTVELLSGLQKNPKNIRNICILAHVDHGKTTLADALVASNGIISSRLAGKLRYMDSREDEQIRGITMKSSAISLHYTKEEQDYLINLIDSPGHVDFSSEVSTAVRLCDGAIVVVDVVEGVSPQTHVVLRQAWLENIRPCLVLNKIDRLITELKYSPTEAHTHLQQILEQVNAITGGLFSTDVMEKSSSKPVTKVTQHVMDDDSAVSIDDWSSGLEETDDSSLYFSPDLGNVVFASAIDGWGFSINDFVELYSKKLGIKAEMLQKTLWGDYYLDNKTKRIFKKAQSKGKKPLFVQFILQNIWAVYDAVMIRRDKTKSEQIANSLKLKISVRDSRHSDPRVHLHAICSQWLPLSAALLSMVVDKLPSPLEISSERIEKLMCSGIRSFESLPPETKQLKQDFMTCRSVDDAPLIVFVSKMFAVDDQSLPKHKRKPLTQEEITQRREAAKLRHVQMTAEATPITGTPTEADPLATLVTSETPIVDTSQDAENKTHFMAFARVYSGTIRKGQHLYVLGPKHDPRNIMNEEINSLNEAENQSPEKRNEGLSAARSVDCGTNQHVALFTVEDLYLLMGRELESLDAVPAGNVLGIGGLQECVLKSATISSTVLCPPFTAIPIAARPIVRVAIEPVHVVDMPALSRGMRLLNQADPCVQTLVQETGEHVIVAAGEVHLQRCVDDLKERFACVKLNVSDPIIPFRETVVTPPTMDRVNEAITGDSSTNSNTQASNLEAYDSSKNKDKLVVEMKTANKQCTIYIRATPLPDKVAQLLDKSGDLIKLLLTASINTTGSDKKSPLTSNLSVAGSEELEIPLTTNADVDKKSNLQIKSSTRQQLQEFYKELQDAFKEAGSEWCDAIDRIWSFGPRRTGPNVLLNRIPDYQRPSIWQSIMGNDTKQNTTRYMSYDNSIVSGFQMATLAGPLCAEPLMGVCFVIENLVMDTGQTGTTGVDTSQTGTTGTDTSQTSTTGSVQEKTGSIPEKGDIKSTKEGIEIENIKVLEFEQRNSENKLTQLSENETEKINSNSEQRSSETNITSNQNLSSQLAVGTDSDITEVENALTNDEYNREKNSDDTKVEVETKAYGNARSFDKTGRWGPFSGQLMSAVKEGCRRAFQLQPMRLMAAMYTCRIQANAGVLGKMYAVIAKREGRVLSDEMKEGSDVFEVEAVIPVAESFGLAEEIRKRTSGVANPQLVFSHWEVIDIDPYWVPTTEEEYTHFGEKADSENQARKYMNSVRRRKGLYIEEKTVEHAEKQRTLKK